ncbi:MAG: Elongation factor 1-alpha [Candidatus Methanofastidiosum methylothiophilum]|uniref:sulfate adenylyltransferase n=1 Tax=Candidatus Methanofastidiosum methylothiophilum TaxID=1705564 RepID=A0A150J8K9_9EURY|nr:MAG: Elongation factor 1-alpha [Candidatus Methanofastidiosum methylthiophilus]
MDEGYLKFVIVGHVDHGKSTLIGRLLYDTGSIPIEKVEEIKNICDSLGKQMEFGYVMDHLEEEREQGITIETTQTFFKTNKRNYVIIDAPGHVEFLKNMITGASQAEAAILIIDAEEGVREQTKRHAYILSMLGISQVIVVINKMDLISFDREKFESIKSDLLNFLKEIGITPSYIIPISAKEGDFVASKSANLPWYSGPTVLEALDSFIPKERSVKKPLRFAVQDVYNFDKRIVAGRVESGLLKKDQSITILPSGEKTKVKSIEEFLKTTEEAEPGKSTGLTTLDKLFVDRGNIIVDSDDMSYNVTTRFRASIFWMDKLPYKLGTPILLRCATQEVMCRVETILKLMDSSTLEVLVSDSGVIRNREAADVMIATDKEIVVDDFLDIPETGRFVLGKEVTVAGGIVKGGKI